MDEQENAAAETYIEYDECEDDDCSDDFLEATDEDIFDHSEQWVRSNFQSLMRQIADEEDLVPEQKMIFEGLASNCPVFCTGYLHSIKRIEVNNKKTSIKNEPPEWMLNRIRRHIDVITAPHEVEAVKEPIVPSYRLSVFRDVIEAIIKRYSDVWLGKDGRWLSKELHHWATKKKLIFNALSGVFFHRGVTTMAPSDEFLQYSKEGIGIYLRNPKRWNGNQIDLQKTSRKKYVIECVMGDVAEQIQAWAEKTMLTEMMLKKWSDASLIDYDSFGKGCSVERHRIMEGAFQDALARSEDSLMEAIRSGIMQRGSVEDDSPEPT